MKHLSFRYFFLLVIVSALCQSLYSQVITETFTTSGNFIVPCGVTSITVECWGGGGGGGSRTSNGVSGGGGGGAYATSTFTVSSGNSFPFTVAGAAGAGTTGASSTFNTNWVIAVGGAGVPNNTLNGGAGGLASACTPVLGAFNGGNGSAGSGNNTGAGGGGAGTGGVGGNASASVATAGTTAGVGTAFGGGNGGAGRVNSNGDGNGGANYGGGGGGTKRGTVVIFPVGGIGGTGGPGLVRVSYNNPFPTAPSVLGGSRCGTGSVGLSASGAGAGEDYNWYTGLTGANLIQGGGSTFNTPPISLTTTYYVTKVNASGCESSPRTPVLATVLNAPGAAVTPSPANASSGVCFSGTGAVGSVTWAATATATSYDVYFGAGSLPGSVTANVATNSYSTGTLLPTTTYHWRVVPKNACGDAVGASTWTFTTLSLPCYCLPTYGNSCAADYISNVTLLSGVTPLINNSTTCTGTTPNNITTYPTPNPTIRVGETYSLSASTGGDTEGLSAWIDYNGNGVFDAAEKVINNLYTGNNPETYTNNSVVVPYTSVVGTTMMRIRCRYQSGAVNATCAGAYSYGETEDYYVTIGCPVNIPDPQLSYVSCAPRVTTTWGGIINWQGSTDNAVFNDIPGANGTTYVIPASTDIRYYRVRGGFAGCSDLISNSIQVIPLTYTGGDLTISSDVVMGGNVTVAGDFTVNAGVTITLPQACVLNVTANNVTINGKIDGNGKGRIGGVGGAGGTDGNSDNGGNTNSFTRGGSGGTTPTGAGAGLAGVSGQNGVDNCAATVTVIFTFGVNIVNGAGGGGAGQGGGYGGTGGTALNDVWSSTMNGAGGRLTSGSNGCGAQPSCNTGINDPGCPEYYCRFR